MARTVVYERPLDAVLTDAGMYDKPLYTGDGLKIKEEPSDPDSNNVVVPPLAKTSDEDKPESEPSTVHEDQISSKQLSNKENEYTSTTDTERPDANSFKRKRIRTRSTTEGTMLEMLVSPKRKRTHFTEISENSERKTKSPRNKPSPKSRKKSADVDLKSTRKKHRLYDVIPTTGRECPVCKIKFAKTSQYNKHIKTYKRCTIRYCNVCNETYSVQAKYEKAIPPCGVNIEDAPRCFTCHFCGQRFLYKKSLICHLYHGHGNLLHLCTKEEEESKVSEPVSPEKEAVENISMAETLKLNDSGLPSPNCSPVKRMRQTTLTEFLQFGGKKQKSEPVTPEKSETRDMVTNLAAAVRRIYSTNEKDTETQTAKEQPQTSSNDEPVPSTSAGSSRKPFVQIHANSDLLLSLLDEGGVHVKKEPMEEDYNMEMNPYSLRTSSRNSFSYSDTSNVGRPRFRRRERSLSSTPRKRKNTHNALLERQLRVKFGCKECVVRLIRCDDKVVRRIRGKKKAGRKRFRAAQKLSPNIGETPETPVPRASSTPAKEIPSIDSVQKVSSVIVRPQTPQTSLERPQTPVERPLRPQTPVLRSRRCSTPVLRGQRPQTPVQRAQESESVIDKPQRPQTPLDKFHGSQTPIERPQRTRTPVQRPQRSETPKIPPNVVPKVPQTPDTQEPPTLIQETPQTPVQTPASIQKTSSVQNTPETVVPKTLPSPVPSTLPVIVKPPQTPVREPPIPVEEPPSTPVEVPPSTQEQQKTTPPAKLPLKNVEVALVKLSPSDCSPTYQTAQQTHVKSEPLEQKAFQCRICRKCFSSRENLREHRELFHVAYISSICSARYTTKLKLMDHYLRQHVLFKRNQCCVCHDIFETRGTLKRHLIVHCIKTLRSPKDGFTIDGEMRCNAFRKNHKCRDCGRRFWLLSCLNEHKKVCLRRKDTKTKESPCKKERLSPRKKDGTDCRAEPIEVKEEPVSDQEEGTNARKTVVDETSNPSVVDSRVEKSPVNKSPSTSRCIPITDHNTKSPKINKSPVSSRGSTNDRSKKRSSHKNLLSSPSSSVNRVPKRRIVRKESSSSLNPSESSKTSKSPSHSLKSNNDSIDLMPTDDQVAVETPNPNPEKYACPVCGVFYANLQKLNGHQRVYSKPAAHPCVMCGTSFTTKRLLQGHLNATHGTYNANYKLHCRFCNQGFVKKETMIIHESHLHAHEILTTPVQAWLTRDQVWNINTVCNVCNLMFETYDRFIEHNMYYYKGHDFSCTFCGQVFQGMFMLHHHSKLWHYPEETRKSYRYTCDRCNEGFSHESHLHAHKLHVHLNESSLSSVRTTIPTPCPLDNCNPTSMETRQVSINAFSCKVCGLNFPNAKDLARHDMEYSPDGVYSCDKCDRKCQTPTVLLKHQCLTHDEGSVDSRYKCRFCGEVLTTSISMACHEKHFHRDPTTEKPEDQKETRSNEKEDSMTKNIQLATEEIRDSESKRISLRCLTCGMTFNKNIELKNHLMEYSDIGEYDCSICHRRFVELPRLEAHKVKHSRLNFILSSHHCPICHEGFTSVTQVRTHVLHLHGYESFQNVSAQRSLGSKTSSGNAMRVEEVTEVGAMVEPTPSTSNVVDGPVPSTDSDRNVPTIVIDVDEADASKSKGRSTSEKLLKKDLSKLIRCTECGLLFTNQRNLSKHKARFLNEGDHVCTVCNLRFPWASALEEHQSRHSSKTDASSLLHYDCAHCPQKFRTRKSAHAHLYHRHGAEMKLVVPDPVRLHRSLHEMENRRNKNPSIEDDFEWAMSLVDSSAYQNEPTKDPLRLDDEEDEISSVKSLTIDLDATEDDDRQNVSVDKTNRGTPSSDGRDEQNKPRQTDVQEESTNREAAKDEQRQKKPTETKVNEDLEGCEIVEQESVQNGQPRVRTQNGTNRYVTRSDQNDAQSRPMANGKDNSADVGAVKPVKIRILDGTTNLKASADQTNAQSRLSQNAKGDPRTAQSRPPQYIRICPKPVQNRSPQTSIAIDPKNLQNKPPLYIRIDPRHIQNRSSETNATGDPRTAQNRPQQINVTGDPRTAQSRPQQTNVTGDPRTAQSRPQQTNVTGDPRTAQSRPQQANVTGDPRTAQSRPQQTNVTGDPRTAQSRPQQTNVTGDPRTAQSRPQQTNVTGDPRTAQSRPQQANVAGDPRTAQSRPQQMNVTGDPRTAQSGQPRANVTGDPRTAQSRPQQTNVTGDRPAQSRPQNNTRDDQNRSFQIVPGQAFATEYSRRSTTSSDQPNSQAEPAQAVRKNSIRRSTEQIDIQENLSHLNAKTDFMIRDRTTKRNSLPSTSTTSTVSYTCPICLLHQADLEQLELHFQLHYPKKRPRMRWPDDLGGIGCMICDESFVGELQFKEHLEKRHMPHKQISSPGSFNETAIQPSAKSNDSERANVDTSNNEESSRPKEADISIVETNKTVDNQKIGKLKVRPFARIIENPMETSESSKVDDQNITQNSFVQEPSPSVNGVEESTPQAEERHSSYLQSYVQYITKHTPNP